MAGHNKMTKRASAQARARDADNLRRLEALHDAWPLLYEGGADDLANIRHRLGVSQVDLAARLEVSQPAISRFEATGNPTVAKVADYLEALGARLHLVVELDNGELLPLDLRR